MRSRACGGPATLEEVPIEERVGRPMGLQRHDHRARPSSGPSLVTRGSADTEVAIAVYSDTAGEVVEVDFADQVLQGALRLRKRLTAQPEHQNTGVGARWVRADFSEAGPATTGYSSRASPAAYAMADWMASRVREGAGQHLILAESGGRALGGPPRENDPHPTSWVGAHPRRPSAPAALSLVEQRGPAPRGRVGTPAGEPRQRPAALVMRPLRRELAVHALPQGKPRREPRVGWPDLCQDRSTGCRAAILAGCR